MELEKAKVFANVVVKALGPYCDKIEVAGSIRRQKPTVNDIDLVAIPRDRWNLDLALMRMGNYKMSGMKIARVEMDSIPLDIYFATPETWAMTLLVRTGSANHNIRLAARAKQLGLHFAADGRGILRDGNPVAWQSEEEIFAALGLAYQAPEERG